MIDLHSHILPGIDDGPRTVEEAVALGRAAWLDGTRVMAATPHMREDHPLVRPHELADRCRVVERALAEAGIGLRVVPAAEVDLMWASSATRDEMRLCTFGQAGTDMLVETPYGQLPPTFEDLLFRISLQGFRILLAHPERNPTFQRHPERLLELVERGLLVQLTAESLISRDKNSRSRRLAHWLIAEDAAHVVASDSHSVGPWRAPGLTLAHGAVARKDPARADWMMRDVPAAILAGEPLPALPRAPAAGLSRLLGRRTR